MDQGHLMLKDDNMRPYMVIKMRYDWNKAFLLGLIVWNKVISCFISPLFIMFLYIREMLTKAGDGIPDIDEKFNHWDTYFNSLL